MGNLLSIINPKVNLEANRNDSRIKTEIIDLFAASAANSVISPRTVFNVYERNVEKGRKIFQYKSD